MICIYLHNIVTRLHETYLYLCDYPPVLERSVIRLFKNITKTVWKKKKKSTECLMQSKLYTHDRVLYWMRGFFFSPALCDIVMKWKPKNVGKSLIGAMEKNPKIQKSTTAPERNVNGTVRLCYTRRIHTIVAGSDRKDTDSLGVGGRTTNNIIRLPEHVHNVQPFYLLTGTHRCLTT